MFDIACNMSANSNAVDTETFAQLRFDLKPNSRLRFHPVKKIAENMIKLSDIY